MSSHSHEYSPREARELLLGKLDAANADLASQVRAAIDAGRDIDTEERSSSGGKRGRRYRKAVPLSEEEALEAACDVLQAYFIEQPMFAASALENARAAALGGPRNETGGSLEDPRIRPAEGQASEKIIEVDFGAETQLTTNKEEAHRLRRPDAEALATQHANLTRLRELFTFREG